MRRSRTPFLAAAALLGCSDAPPSALLSHLPVPRAAAALPASPPARARRCPADMVDVRGQLCVDRYETSLVHAGSGAALSPYYHPTRALALRDHKAWQWRHAHEGPQPSRSIALPELPEWQRAKDFDIRALSVSGRVPSAYLDLAASRRACQNAGKRLCTRAEWTLACRGEAGTRHPYGEHYEPARCNVDGPLHPATVLHGKSNLGQLDPRLNLVERHGQPLLKKTGASPGCASRWGEDAIYDMVGNLDEWIDEPGGTFLGGFYARDTQWGCDARIEVHSPDYYDYSLGTRCCR